VKNEKALEATASQSPVVGSERVMRYERTEAGTVIKNMVVDPQGRIYKRPRSRLRLAWLVLRGWEVYGR
jgi:hypothetical protein